MTRAIDPNNWTPSEMIEPFVAVVVNVPAEYFSDDDELCLAAGRFVCARLRKFLVEKGHLIAEWLGDGCDEDWGVYFASENGGDTFEYQICFFPTPSGTAQTQMMIQYSPKTSFVRRLFTKALRLAADHKIHETMREFGETFDSSRMLTQSGLDTEY